MVLQIRKKGGVWLAVRDGETLARFKSRPTVDDLIANNLIVSPKDVTGIVVGDD